MTREQNIRAILECNFAGFQEEIIETAVEKICELDQVSSEDCISRNEVLKLFATHDGKYLYEAIRDMDSVRDLTTDIKDKIISRMWNCRSKKTLTIDKVKMETIIREEFAEQEPKTDITLERYKVGDVYYEKNTVVGISKRTGTVSEIDVEIVDVLPTDVLDKIVDDIQTLRGCSCGNSDGIIDDVEDIIDKYRQEGI